MTEKADLIPTTAELGRLRAVARGSIPADLIVRGGLVLSPGTEEWLAFDPTNDPWANDRYVTVAWGRDYGDVSPVKGIIFTKAKTSTLRVSVDVAPIED